MSDQLGHEPAEWVNTAPTGCTPTLLHHFMLEANFIGGNQDDNRLRLAFVEFNNQQLRELAKHAPELKAMLGGSS